MFTAQKALFLYAVSPVHMGAGTALGLIDNPIQRERHTDHPMMAGSGLKGAVRHHFWALFPDQRDKLNRYFGPDTKASDYAGAISFSDAQLVAFPVRCSKAGFVYATSPLALARAQRLLNAEGVGVREPAEWKISSLDSGKCWFTNATLLSHGKLQVDVFELEATPSEELRIISKWLAENVFPADASYAFFKEKFKTDLVMMSDDDFAYFVRNATAVEPHVRINNETGVADGGGLFYTENLPPESVLISLVMASDERSKQSEKSVANTIINDVVFGRDGFGGLHGKLLQVGGDASTGRGQIVVTAVEVK